jgi:hypothetical protein
MARLDFATVAQLFCYPLSSESSVVSVASSTSFFYFVGEPVFNTLKQKTGFLLPAAKRTRVSTGTRWLGNQIL